jgi:hypothetical protein
MDLLLCAVQYSGAMAGTALEMAAGMDRYMQLQQDQVPFKVRAKRGCATHPRSIAERVRPYTHEHESNLH